jgi:CubicO group peptidase (beta-lactamase class C family)
MRIVLIICALAALLVGQPLPLSSPEKEGLSSERLGRLHNEFEKLTREGKKAGAIVLIARNGKIADWRSFGHRDIENALPMERDSICRIWSMTKVITSVAVLQLLEEGKINLNDPVHMYVPELKDVKVYQSGTADDPVLAPAARPITIKHLLTHTSGLTYPWGDAVVPELYRRSKLFDVASLKEFAGKVGQLPLVAHPGDKYEYGINTDILGYVVQVVSDIPFDQFVQKRILDPLKMKDTSFQLPAAKKSRLAKTYTYKDGKLGEPPAVVDLTDRGVPFGGMGLYSTIGDYARFGQMLLNGGQLEGVRILSRKTVELMTTNHLNHMPKPTIDANGSNGFGLGGSVRIDLAKGNRLGSVGMFGWSGAASTYFSMDPKEKTVALLFLQYTPFDSPTLEKFSTLFYQAIAD